MKSLWEGDKTAGMIYRQMPRDFTIESKIDIVKNSSLNEMPDRGFQQAGIIVRRADGKKENYVLLSLGTGGNSNPKMFFKRTTDNKSKTIVFKHESMNGWIRIQRKEKIISAFFKSGNMDAWKKTGEYELSSSDEKLQLGLMVFAHFAGDGPKMRPDMRALFSGLKIEVP